MSKLSKMNLRWIIAPLLLCAVGHHSYSQEHRKSFGQNRLQFKNFDWYYYSTDNFDIHYYNNGQEYAELALEYLEEEFDNITDILGYPPYNKTKIFLYNSPSDMLQSNIGGGRNDIYDCRSNKFRQVAS